MCKKIHPSHGLPELEDSGGGKDGSASSLLSLQNHLFIKRTFTWPDSLTPFDLMINLNQDFVKRNGPMTVVLKEQGRFSCLVHTWRVVQPYLECSTLSYCLSFTINEVIILRDIKYLVKARWAIGVNACNNLSPLADNKQKIKKGKDNCMFE